MRPLGPRIASPRGTFVCLIAIWAALILGQVTPCFDMNPDSARYLDLAQSISAGRGYMLEGRPCRLYPPLFPLMLSTVSDPGRHDFRPEKLILALSGLGAVLGSYWLLSQRYGGKALAVLAVLVAVSPPLLRYSGRLRSDVPFMFFAAVYLAATERFWRARSVDRLAGALSGAALAAATLTRSAGLVFYVTATAWLARPAVWRRENRKRAVFAAATLVVAALPAVAWIGWVARTGGHGTPSYLEFLLAEPPGDQTPSLAGGLLPLLLRELRVIPLQLSAAGSTLFSVGGGTMAPLWAVLFLPVLALGFVQRTRPPGPLEYSFAGYCLMVLLWPGPQGTRLWLPVLPLMLGYLADGVAGLGRIRRPLALWGAALLLTVGAVAGLGRVAQSWMRCRDAVGGVLLSTETLDVALFLNAPHERPVLLAYPRSLEVAPALTKPEAGVMGVPRTAQDGRALLDQLSLTGATHLAVGRKIRIATAFDRSLAEARDLLLAMPDAHPLVWETEHVQVFQLAPQPPAQPPPHS